MNKDTKGKVRLNLLPPNALEKVARIREFGVNKYGNEWGWLQAVSSEEFIEATKRHLLEIDKGFLIDPESHELHLTHAATSLLMALEIVLINSHKGD